MKWTKEEIKNSKEIAKYFRKEIDKGDWYLDIDLTLLSTSGAWVGQKLSPDLIPLWTLTDCLEWLEERIRCQLFIENTGYTEKSWKCQVLRASKEIIEYASTPTASAQSAVLEILKGETE